jgi:hypothetical protein
MSNRARSLKSLARMLGSSKGCDGIPEWWARKAAPPASAMDTGRGAACGTHMTPLAITGAKGCCSCSCGGSSCGCVPVGGDGGAAAGKGPATSAMGAMSSELEMEAACWLFTTFSDTGYGGGGGGVWGKGCWAHERGD